MKALNIFLVILVVGGHFDSIQAQTSDTTEPSIETPTEETPTSSTDESTTSPESEETTTPSTSSTTPSTTTTKKPATCKVPKCYRNENGICRTFDIPCHLNNPNVKNNNVIWKLTKSSDCFNRAYNQAKVCDTDCGVFSKAICVGMNPVCAYSATTKRCRKFANICLLKKDACSVPRRKDWRVATLATCQGLAINAPAVPCTL